MTPPTPTSTQTLVAELVAALADGLPDLLEAAGLPIPADDHWFDHIPALNPTSRTPYCGVDTADMTQQGAGSSGKMRRTTIALVIYAVAGPDESWVANAVRGAGDLITKLLEGLGLTDVNSIDVPSAAAVILPGSSTLFRGIKVTAEIGRFRTRGDS